MKYYKRLRPSLGTFVEIGTREKSVNKECAIDEAFNAIARVNKLLSFHNPNSELSRLNNSYGKVIELHPLSMRVLKLAKLIGQYSNGLFNCTVAGILVDKGVLPNHFDSDFLKSGNCNDIELYKNHARLCRPVLISLDGIAKGYAVDYAIFTLKKHGLETGWVNAGGDLRVYGDILLPTQRRELTGGFSNLGNLHNAALSTSWIKPHHDQTYPGWIVAGNKGKPVEGTWSILAKKSWLADALTKVAGLVTQEKRSILIEQLGGKLVQPVSS
ncbi:MAG: FAD:protein FMN transferase [marine bacterium B5-7]|nr:MAG: FAD:protein FMN transferase [marine bacterium B5-7]